jgi:predicted PurR-regulated permease PerM
MSDFLLKRQPPRALKWAILLAATGLVLYLCILILRPFAGVIAWSTILSIAFYPAHRRMAELTGRPSLSALLTSVLVIVTILIPLAFITGLAVNQFLALRTYLQEMFKDGFDPRAILPLQRVLNLLSQWLGLDTSELTNWLTQNASRAGGAVGGFTLSVVASLSTGVVSFVFTIFAMFFLFRDGDRMVARIPDLLPLERTRSQAALERVRDVIYASVYGVFVIAVLQGLLCALMFWMLGIPSAVLWGVVTVLTSVLPLVGSAAVWVPGTIYLLATGRWPQAIVLAVWGAVVIGSVDNFLRPKLVGGQVGLSELVMFFSILGGMQLFGLLGIVLGPVLFAIAGSIFTALSEDREATAEGS